MPRGPRIRAPVGLRPAGLRPSGKRGFLVAADDLAAASANLVAGANREGWHLRNVNHGRDYIADVVADFAAAPPGAACARCGSPLQMLPAVRVARLSRLGAGWSEQQGLRVLGRDGRPQPVLVTAAGSIWRGS